MMRTTMYDKVEVGQRMEMPKEHEKMKSMHHFKEEKFPFAISADLRGLTVPRDNPLGLSSRLKFTKSIPLAVI